MHSLYYRHRSFANWNSFGCNYDDATIRGVADALVATGLATAGYSYVLIQECIVPAGARNATTHELIPDATKFPFGLAALVAYIHARGLRAGVYTDVAHLTCAGFEGSGPGPDDPAGHWPLDALTFARWGFDMIEVRRGHDAGSDPPEDTASRTPPPPPPRRRLTSAIQRASIAAPFRCTRRRATRSPPQLQ